VLGFVGVKMLISHWYELPVYVTLIVVVVVLASTMLSSWWIQRQRNQRQRQ